MGMGLTSKDDGPRDGGGDLDCVGARHGIEVGPGIIAESLGVRQGPYLTVKRAELAVL